MAKSYRKSENDSRDSGRFISLPISLLDSVTYQRLNFSAKALLIDIASQFKGENNGKLVACDKFLKPRGWKSKATIHKALKELLESGLLIMTRQGARPNKASWFGVAWYGLGCRVVQADLDFNGSTFERERHQWKAQERDLQIQSRPSINGLGGVRTVPINGLKGSHVEPKNGPISSKNNSLLVQ